MTLEVQVQALLDLVEADRAGKCAAIARDAKASAGATLAAARAEARKRVRNAFAEERERLETRLAEAQARLQTHRRLHEQRRASALLAVGWQKLPGVLAARWSSPSTRRSWVESVVAHARAALPAAAWRIVHAAGWPENECSALVSALGREHGRPPLVELDSSAAAGIKVVSGSNVVDGMVTGLIGDRAEVGARLLQELELET